MGSIPFFLEPPSPRIPSTHKGWGAHSRNCIRCLILEHYKAFIVTRFRIGFREVGLRLFNNPIVVFVSSSRFGRQPGALRSDQNVLRVDVGSYVLL